MEYYNALRMMFHGWKITSKRKGMRRIEGLLIFALDDSYDRPNASLDIYIAAALDSLEDN